MRRAQTPLEAKLWQSLRNRDTTGAKFARQVVIGGYIVDFAARSARLIVEIDGDTHDDRARDAHRTQWLEREGYRVIRFTNRDVNGNIGGVLEAIGAALAAAPRPDPLPGGEREVSA